MKVWTRQDKGIIDILEKEGRYIAKREFIEMKMEDCARFYFEVYSWYSSRTNAIVPKPEDVKYQKEILRSWDRLFDNSYSLSDMRQGC